MPKQLNVNMSFTADTSQAKKQLQDLQKQLTELGKGSGLGDKIIDPKAFQEASSAIAKLKVQLSEATDQKTGTLDLSKFKSQLDQGGTSLAKYGDQLAKLGPAGQKAFNNLTDSILMAEVPLKRTNALLDQFWTALQNTARWQISSSALHGFMGAVQGAYGYAQDLNKSLNSIRIVTGQSTEQMAELAVQANKSAQALSTSTLAYTDAALIFYQQGLDDAQVAERVEATLKLSNVTGETADEISSYMTAIWNNFAEGGESLESYIDKITALGAATASSSREIAGGLQQFAAIANTVGLSYDYAATALATVVAQTRQSESTVGNAFRTIFSRLEGLKLGETLEDGTDLNKYSGALATIGVNIKDQNGELKEMDTILDEIGAKWQSLSRDQQMALAQTVGGVRQYANLIALFDNWDTFQKNLSVAQNAEGTLDEQAKIYAESWEAAQKRVKAAAQEIYQNLIDENFFITILNFTEDLLNNINNIVEAFGGVKGVLASVMSILLQAKGNEIGQGISDALYNFMPASVKREDSLRIKEEAVNANTIQVEDAASTLAVTQSNNLNKYKELQLEILHNAEHLTEQDRKELSILLDQNKALQENTEERARAVDKAKENTDKSLVNVLRTADKDRKDILLNAFSETKGNIPLSDGQMLNGSIEEALKAQYKGFIQAEKGSKEYYKAISNVTEIETYVTEKLGANVEAMGQYSEAVLGQVQAELELKRAEDTLATSTSGVFQRLQAITTVVQPVGVEIVNIARSLSSLVSVVNAVRGIWDTIQNPNLSTWEKFSAIIPALTMAFTALSRVHLIENLRSAATVVVKTAETAARIRNARAIDGEAFSIGKLNKQYVKEQFFSKMSNGFGKIKTFFSDFQKGFELFKSGDFSAAVGGGTASINSFGTALGFLFPILLKIAVVVAAVVVAIKLLDEAFTTTTERVEKAQKALDEANNALERSAKKASEAESAFKSLVDTLDGLDATKDKIAKMTENTAEWREAIAQSNEELISAIDATGQLGEVEILYDKDGLAYLAEEDEEKVKRAAELEAIASRIAKFRDQINVNAKAQDLSIAEGWKEYSDDNLSSWEKIQEGFTGSAFEKFDEITQKLADTQYAGLTSEELAKLLNSDEIPEELQEIKNEFPNLAQNLPLLEAISDAAKEVASKDSDEYKNLIGQQMLSAAGIDSNSVYGQYAQNKLGDANLKKQEEEYNNIINAIRQGANINDIYKEFAAANEGITVKERLGGFLKSTVTDSSGQKLSDEEIIRAVANERTSNYSVQDYYAQNGGSIAEDTKKAYQDEISNQLKRVLDIYGTSGGLNFSDENFEKQLDLLVNLSDEEIEELGGWDGLQEKLDKLEEDHNIPLNVDTDDFSQLKSSVKDEDLLKEVQEFADYIQDNITELDDLSSHLADCRKETERIAYAIMRFDDAIQDVTENYADWSAALAAGGQRAAVALKEMSKAYGNVLDIDGSMLSSQFLNDAENLDQMKAAIEGVEGAYDKLQQAAATDILTNQLGYTADQVSNLLNVIANADEQMKQMSLKPGDVLSDADFAPLYAALDHMLLAVGNDVNAANDILAALGYNAELQEVETEEPQKTEMVDVEPEAYATGGSINVPTLEAVTAGIGAGESGTTQIALEGIRVKPNVHEENTSTKKVVSALKIKPGTLHKAVGGDVKFKRSTHGGGGVSPSSGKSGGGGGGSKKKTTKEHTKTVKNEDRYHDIKERIDDLNKSLTRLSKTENRVYGKAKLKYMDQEIEKLESQIKLTDEYIAEIKKYAAIDQANLRGIGMGAEFDENGMLTNYEQVLANITDSYNAAIGAYNGAVDAFNGSAQEEGDNEALDNAKKQLDAAKETYDENQKILKQYEDTYNLLQEQVDKRIDQVWALFDMRLKKITFEVEFEIDWNERDLKYLDWLLNNIGDTADKGVDKIANLAKQMNEYADTIEWAKKGIQGIFGLHGINFDFDNADPVALTDQLTDAMNRLNFESQLTEDEANALLEYCDTLMEAIDGIKERWEQAHEAVNDTWDKWNERIERDISQLEHQQKIMEGIKEIADLTGRNILGTTTDQIANMGQSMIRNLQDQTAAQKAIWEARQASADEAKRYMENAQTEEIREQWRKTYEQMQDDADAAHENYLSSLANTLSKVQDVFQETMENIKKDYNDAMGDLSLITEQFNRKTEISHLYLDDYEKYHELNKSVNELKKSLENTNNVVIRGKLNDLLDEINQKLNSGVQMSEYQTEVISRRVALLQAEAELMDAQNAKSAVRMTRDNEGNFSYTYTADQEAIDGAQNNYLDKFYEYLQFLHDSQEDIQSSLLQAEQDFMDKYEEIQNAHFDTEEERMAALEDLYNDYLEYRNYFVEQLGYTFDDMAHLRDVDWKDAEYFTGLKLADQDDFVTEFGNTILGSLNQSYQTAEAYGNHWADVMAKTHAAGTKAAQTYQTNVQVTYEKAGEDITKYGETSVKKMEEIADQSDETAQHVDDMAVEMQYDMSDIMRVAWDLDTTWGTVMQNMRDQISQTVSALYTLLQRLQEVQSQAQATIAACAAAAQAQAAANMGNSLGGNGGNTSGTGTTNGSPYSPGGQKGLIQIQNLANGAPSDIWTGVVNGQRYIMTEEQWKKKFGASNNIVPLTSVWRGATGGMTAAWGPEGKFAMLHEKELVLNKEDTSNILNVVDSVRNMVSNFGHNALDNLARAITSSGSLAMAGVGTLDQNVHIEANFPNVQSHTEIELAFNNLVNSASQYVNRK